MMNISAQISNFSASPTAVASPTKLADESPESAATLPVAAPVEGVKVSLSGASIQKAADDKKSNSNADIESSGLPDQTQKTLKMIRELKQQIEEKQQEMQSLMADQSMDPETRQARVGALQTAISTLTASLATANNALVKQGQSGKLSDTQMQQASALAMK
ncbi:hypothetical protein [Pseudomonas viridiflava]|uniref:hypothetical protein n=1 Tax=Pseudomonas viridiflava TaxID=33069 RepID=UPI001F08574B|nr:hypothetical protein [Pseudomonas viridiflava]